MTRGEILMLIGGVALGVGAAVALGAGGGSGGTL